MPRLSTHPPVVEFGGQVFVPSLCKLPYVGERGDKLMYRIEHVRGIDIGDRHDVIGQVFRKLELEKTKSVVQAMETS